MNITYPVTLTHHGAYKYLNKHCLRVKEWIENHIEIISAGYTLRDEIEIRLRPLPKRNKSGSGGSGKIELDISRGLRSIIETLCHELTHEEQVFEGRLCYDDPRHTSWNNDDHGRMLRGGRGKLFERYMAQPWEVEARERAAEQIEKIEQWTGKIPDDVI